MIILSLSQSETTISCSCSHSFCSFSQSVRPFAWISLQQKFDVALPNLDNGDVTLLHAGADGGVAVLTDGCASLYARGGIDADESTIGYALNGECAAIVLNKDRRCITVFNRVNLGA